MNGKKFGKLLEDISHKQWKVDECLKFYRLQEEGIEKKRIHCSNPSEHEEFTREIARLSKEYEDKSDILYEDLNALLLKGHDAAFSIGNSVGHDFKALWDYMTSPSRQEVKREEVVKKILKIKEDL